MQTSLVIVVALLAAVSAAPQFPQSSFAAPSAFAPAPPPTHFAHAPAIPSHFQHSAPVPSFAPQPSFASIKPNVPLISRDEVQDDAGQFSLSYVTGDGITVQEQGVLKTNKEGTDNVLVKQGSYQYTSPEGQLVKVSYIADENGFQPQSPNIPVAAAAPPAVFV